MLWLVELSRAGALPLPRMDWMVVLSRKVCRCRPTLAISIDRGWALIQDSRFLKNHLGSKIMGVFNIVVV